MPKVIVFDVSETLLDVGALDPLFVRLFGDATARREWFGQMLQAAFISTITHAYRDFGTLGMSALARVAERHGVTIGDEDRRALRDGMRQLPPHPEVREAMERLRDAGFRLATLTNSTLHMALDLRRYPIFRATPAGDAMELTRYSNPHASGRTPAGILPLGTG